MSTIILGDSFTINVHIFSSNATVEATGTIILKNHGNGDVIGVQTLSSGNTVFTIDSLLFGLGTHSFIAYYAGDANNAASVSSPITKTIVVSPTK